MALTFACGDKQPTRVFLNSLDDGECFIFGLTETNVYRTFLNSCVRTIIRLSDGRPVVFDGANRVFPVTLDPITYHHKRADEAQA